MQLELCKKKDIIAFCLNEKVVHTFLDAVFAMLMIRVETVSLQAWYHGLLEGTDNWKVAF